MYSLENTGRMLPYSKFDLEILTLQPLLALRRQLLEDHPTFKPPSKLSISKSTISNTPVLGTATLPARPKRITKLAAVYVTLMYRFCVYSILFVHILHIVCKDVPDFVYSILTWTCNVWKGGTKMFPYI